MIMKQTYLKKTELYLALLLVIVLGTVLNSCKSECSCAGDALELEFKNSAGEATTVDQIEYKI